MWVGVQRGLHIRGVAWPCCCKRRIKGFKFKLVWLGSPVASRLARLCVVCKLCLQGCGRG